MRECQTVTHCLAVTNGVCLFESTVCRSSQEQSTTVGIEVKCPVSSIYLLMRRDVDLHSFFRGFRSNRK